ncbi:MAG: secondary thiamine-phosphate synthase enzyme YjbQ [Thermodesulfovibrionales bacterium]|nr:secondary thiamine-phosphate synthase enzyme YjbQ [Thermodesulfovibrionales bacterium]
MVYTGKIKLKAQGFSDVHDITADVGRVLADSGVSEGLVCVFCKGSTGAITTIEYEPGVVEDLKRAIERIAPEDDHYDHNARWGDGNGFSHVRAALLKPSVTVPVIGGQMALGTWQQVVFIDFDNRPRSRELIVQVVGQ